MEGLAASVENGSMKRACPDLWCSYHIDLTFIGCRWMRCVIGVIYPTHNPLYQIHRAQYTAVAIFYFRVGTYICLACTVVPTPGTRTRIYLLYVPVWATCITAVPVVYIISHSLVVLYLIRDSPWYAESNSAAAVL